MTKSPGERSLTSGPTKCTSPTPSYPPTAGTCGLTGYTPGIQLFHKFQAPKEQKGPKIKEDVVK